MKNINSKYAVVSYKDSITSIIVSEEPIHFNPIRDYFLSDVNITFEENIIIVTGNENIFDLAFDKQYVKNLPIRPREADIRVTKFTKKEYVIGWYDTNKYKPYKAIISSYIIEIN